MGTPRVSIVGPLPSPLPHARRFHARDPRLGQDMEFRLAAGEPETPSHRHFMHELALLSVVDHPAFPPVLDRGTYQGKPFLALPLRGGRSLPHVLEDGSLGMGGRARVLQGLAGGLAAAHHHGVTLGGLHPKLVFWTDEREAAEMPFPLSMGTSRAVAGLPALPADRGLAELDPASRDVVHWALLAYWLFAGGDRAFDGDGDVVPLREHGVRVRPELAFVIEACLGRDPAERPAAGGELHRLLGRLDLVFDPERSWDAAVAAKARETVTRELAEVRAEEEVDASRELLEQLAPMVDLVQPLVESSRARLGSLPPWAQGILAVLPAILLGLWLAWPRIGPYFRRGLLGGAVVEGQDLAALRRNARLAGDPYVQGLLAVGEVTPANFVAVWTRFRNLSLRGRLPEELDDPPALDALRARFDGDPAPACDALAGLLVELERLVGEPGG